MLGLLLLILLRSFLLFLFNRFTMLLYSLLSKILRLVILSVIWLFRNELLIFSFFNYVLINVYLMVSLRDHL